VKHVGVDCYTVPGVGSDLKVQIETAGSTSAILEDTPSLSYIPPTIKNATLEFEDKPLQTQDGGTLLIWGVHFGAPDKSGKLSCGNWRIPNRFTGECVVTAPQSINLRSEKVPKKMQGLEVMRCSLREGVGALSEFQVEIQGTKSPFYHSNQIIQFAPPVIEKVGRTKNTGLEENAEFSPKGGEVFTLKGSNFGPKGTSVRVQYSTSFGLTYTAVNCQVTEAHRTVQCYTTPGSGKNWIIWTSVESTVSVQRFQSQISYEDTNVEIELDNDGNFELYK
jgi:hypothetical protein